MHELKGVQRERSVDDLAANPEQWLVAFARALRGAGLAVPVASVTVFVRAAAAVGLDTREGLYWAGRATLLTTVADVATYDATFAALFDHGSQLRPIDDLDAAVAMFDEDDPDLDPDSDDTTDEETEPIDGRAVRYSATEVLAERDFSRLDEAEWAEVERLIARLRIPSELRRSRRRRPSQGRRRHPDLRTTLRRSLRTDGVPIERAWRSPTVRERQVVLLIDVSGSMEPYARALFRFAHCAASGRPARRTEVFALGTRLTHLTPVIGGHDADVALSRSATSVVDWSGGTRLGDGLRELNNRWARRGVGRGAVVVILSDGWDRGEPSELASEMARLRRIAHRVVWSNPLKASEGYQPIARGMAAALPFVDTFVEGHTLRSLEHLADVIGGHASGPGR